MAFSRTTATAVAALACLLAACSGGSTSPHAGSSTRSTPPSHRASKATSHPSPSTARTLRPITLAFGGDVHFMGSSRRALDGFGSIAAPLRAADLAMVNLETAVTERGTPAPKQFVFRAPAAAFAALRGAGIDVVTMANNHGEDYGRVGLADSLAAAHAAHFPVVGIGADEAAAYAPFRTTIRGVRVAVIGATQVLDENLISAWTATTTQPGLASAKRVDRLLQAVRDARRDADVLVVDLHWGRELSDCPTDDQHDLERQLVAAGVDVLVGSHAHVLLGGGWDGSSYVDYGLGNFVFYVGGGGPTGRSGVLTLTVTGRHVDAAHWTPAAISAGIPSPLTGGAATAARQSWAALRGCTGLAAAPTAG